jgi:hypothetical protein
MNHVIPLGRGHLPHRLVHGDPGVVDQDVELPVLVKHLVGDPDAVVVGADVALVDGCPVIGVLLTEALGRLVVAGIAGRDRHAAVDQPFADGQPNTAGSPGDQGDLTSHVSHGATLPDSAVSLTRDPVDRKAG